MMTRDKENIWEYSCDLIFNGRKITKLTITDHYLAKHAKIVDNELIRQIVNELDGEDLEPEPKDDEKFRDVFVWEFTFYQGKYENKSYRLIFWFKDNTTNHLWIRNCYRLIISNKI
jgi:hypothetical protein